MLIPEIFLEAAVNAGKLLFAQLMDFLPWTSFARSVARYGGDRRVECPAPFVPVEMRETGTRGALDGTRKEAHGRADCEPASSG